MGLHGCSTGRRALVLGGFGEEERREAEGIKETMGAARPHLAGAENGS